MEWLKELGPLLIALGGLSGITAIAMLPSQIRKMRSDTRMSEADAASRLSSASIALLEPAQRELKRMERSLSAMSSKAVDLEEKLAIALGELAELRTSMGQMSKELSQALEENARLKGLS